MPDVKSSRREKAARTRARIIEAAHAEFLERGFHGATIASVASRAGVATQTVYFVFHTKAELISAVIDAMVMAPDPATGEVLPPELTPWWLDMVADPDPVSSLRRFVRGVAPLYERAAAVSEVLRAAALTDDEVRRTHEHHVRLQREGFGGVVRMLGEKGSCGTASTRPGRPMSCSRSSATAPTTCCAPSTAGATKLWSPGSRRCCPTCSSAPLVEERVGG